MSLKIFRYLLSLLFLSLSCNIRNSDRFDIKIVYSSAWGPQCYYYLNEEGIKVFGDKNGKRTNVYKRNLSSTDKDSIFLCLSKINFDTLQPIYEDNTWFDGTTVNYTIKFRSSVSKDVMVYMTATAATDSLKGLLDKYILDLKYKNPFWRD